MWEDRIWERVKDQGEGRRGPEWGRVREVSPVVARHVLLELVG